MKSKIIHHILLWTDPFEIYLSEIPYILIAEDSENGRNEYVDQLLEQLTKNYSSKDLHLAQNWRAAGMHVILSVNYLERSLSRAKTLSLRANLSMRILFKTNNFDESESIINGLGNEQIELK